MRTEAQKAWRAYVAHHPEERRPVGHQATHGACRTPTYEAWCHMKTRCYDAKYSGFKYWGGRGIVVCERWLNSFENFLSDMGERPLGPTRFSLDRFPNNNGNYEPGNVRWATRSEQARNRSI